mgnify:CR=1 FL=1
MRKHRVLVLTLVALLFAIAVAGCSGSEATDQRQHNLATPVVDKPYTTSSSVDLQRHSPFKLKVPNALPPGYTFASGLVTPAGAGDAVNNAMKTKVTMTFTADGKPPIRVTETRERPTTQVDSEDHRGDGTVARSITVIGPSLTYTVEAVDVPREDLLGIVRSLLP